MTTLPAFRPFTELAAEWDRRANAASRSGTPKSPPSPVDQAASTAQFILAAGRWRRGEEDKPEYVDQNEKRQRRQDKDDEDKEPQPGDLILDAIRRQQEEGGK
jgi:hypothetical protein